MKTFIHHTCVLLMALIVSAPCVTQAQNQGLLDAQRRLDSKAREAVTAGDFEAAIQFWRSSLQLGELNITHLNLGRAYFRAGQCDRAVSSFDKVEGAPKAPKPAPEQISAALERYRAELHSACPGTLKIVCQPGELDLDLNGESLTCGKSFSVKPGEHVLSGSLGERRVDVPFEMEAMQSLVLEIDLRPVEAPEPVAQAPEVVVEVPPEPVDEGAWMRRAGLVTAGLGVAAIGAGVGLRLSFRDEFDELQAIAASPEPDRARFEALSQTVEDRQTGMMAAFIVGGALIAAGGTLFVFGLGDTPEREEGPDLSLGVGPGSLFLQGRF